MSKSSATAAPAKSSLPKWLLYFGIGLLAGAALVFYNAPWTSLGNTGKIVTTLDLGLALYFLSLLALKRKYNFLATLVLLSIASVLEFTGLTTGIDLYFKGSFADQERCFEFLLVFLQQLFTFLKFRRPEPLFTTISLGIISLSRLSLLIWTHVFPDLEIMQVILSQTISMVLCIGGLYWGFKLKNTAYHSISRPLYKLSSTLFLMSAYMAQEALSSVYHFKLPFNLPPETVTLPLIAAVIYFGLRNKDLYISILGALTIFGALPGAGDSAFLMAVFIYMQLKLAVTHPKHALVFSVATMGALLFLPICRECPDEVGFLILGLLMLLTGFLADRFARLQRTSWIYLIGGLVVLISWDDIAALNGISDFRVTLTGLFMCLTILTRSYAVLLITALSAVYDVNYFTDASSHEENYYIPLALYGLIAIISSAIAYKIKQEQVPQKV